MSNKLRIALIIDSDRIAAWRYESIRRINNLDCVEIVSLIELQPKKTQTASSLYRLFDYVDRHVFRKRTKPDPFAPEYLSTLLPKTPRIKLTTDAHKIFNSQIDVMILCIEGDIDLSIDPLSQHMIWAHYHADPQTMRGSPFGFWEAMERRPVTGHTLEIYNGNAGSGQILQQSFSTTVSHSPTANRQRYYWTSAAFAARKLDELHNLGKADFLHSSQSRYPAPNIYSGQVYKPPGNLEMLLLGIKYCIEVARLTILDRRYWSQWHMAFQLSDNANNNLQEYTFMPLPNDEFWADPFIVERDNKYYIFLEVYTQARRLGHLSVIEMDKDGNYSPPTTILKKDYHLSYPLIIELGDKLYMLPETKTNNSIELYECIEFPHKWSFKMNLMENIRAVDTTPFYHNGKWWLFTTIAPVEGALAREELHLFYADELLTSNWTPHPLNPVISDARNARPAGDIFIQGNKVIRPSQDCSYTYGYGINFNEITCLSTEDYSEKTVSQLTPDWSDDVHAIHTYSRKGRLTVIDAERKIRLH